MRVPQSPFLLQSGHRVQQPDRFAQQSAYRAQGDNRALLCDPASSAGRSRCIAMWFPPRSAHRGQIAAHHRGVRPKSCHPGNEHPRNRYIFLRGYHRQPPRWQRFRSAHNRDSSVHPDRRSHRGRTGTGGHPRYGQLRRGCR